jgi:hypothetical protein
MSLDFAVLGSTGAPEATVQLGVELHHQLLSCATVRNLRSLLTFEDYYEDAEVSIEQLPTLASEVQFLSSEANSAELRMFLGALDNLITSAILTGRSLHAIAD